MPGAQSKARDTSPTEPVDDDGYLSLSKGAKYVDVSVWTLRRAIADGRIAGYRFAGKLVRVRKIDLDAMIERIPTT